MFKQAIKKAFVFILMDIDNIEYRIYAPYTGNFTKAVEQKINKNFHAYCEHKEIFVKDYFGWKTKDILIKWPEKTDSYQMATYKENDASGAVKKETLLVCAFDFAIHNK